MLTLLLVAYLAAGLLLILGLCRLAAEGFDAD